MHPQRFANLWQQLAADAQMIDAVRVPCGLIWCINSSTTSRTVCVHDHCWSVLELWMASAHQWPHGDPPDVARAQNAVHGQTARAQQSLASVFHN